MALPGIFGLFLSRFGCLGSFEFSVDCTGPIVGDLVKKLDIFLSLVGCWFAGATLLLFVSAPDGFSIGVAPSFVKSTLLLGGFAGAFDDGSTALRDGVSPEEEAQSPAILGDVVVGEPRRTDVGVDGSVGFWNRVEFNAGDFLDGRVLLRVIPPPTDPGASGTPDVGVPGLGIPPDPLELWEDTETFRRTPYLRKLSAPALALEADRPTPAFGDASVGAPLSTSLTVFSSTAVPVMPIRKLS